MDVPFPLDPPVEEPFPLDPLLIDESFPPEVLDMLLLPLEPPELPDLPLEAEDPLDPTELPAEEPRDEPVEAPPLPRGVAITVIARSVMRRARVVDRDGSFIVIGGW